MIIFSNLVHAIYYVSALYYYKVDQVVKDKEAKKNEIDCVNTLLQISKYLKDVKSATLVMEEVDSWKERVEKKYAFGEKLDLVDKKALEDSALNWLAKLKRLSIEFDKEQKTLQLIEERIKNVETNISPISKNIEAFISKVESASISFVECSPTERSLEPKLRGLLNRSCIVGKELMLTGYFDQYLLKAFMALTPKPKIKFISPELTNSKGDKINMDALKRLQKMGAEVRFHPMLHARVICNSTEVIVGSSDIKSDCLGGRRFDAGIWSNNPVLILDVATFFQKVWNEATPMS